MSRNENPLRTFSQVPPEPSRFSRQRVLKTTRNIITGGVIGGLAAYSTYDVVTDHLIPNYASNTYGPERYTSEKHDGLEGLIENHKKGIDDLTLERTQELLKKDYSSFRDALSQVISYEKRSNNPDVESFVKEKRQKLVLDGINMIKGYFGKGSINIDKNEGTIMIPESRRPLLIDNSYDSILLDQYIIYNMRLQTAKTVSEESSAQQSIKDISWLINSDNLDVEIVDESAFLFDDQSLVNLSRFCQMLERNKINNFPPVNIFSDIGKNAGLYIHPIGNTTIADEIRTVNEGAEFVLPHEFGHFVSYASEKFSQNEFNKRVNNVKEKLQEEGYTSHDPKASYSDGVVKEEKEDYASTFEDYFNNGTAFRNRLKSLAVENPTEFEILLVKYKFANEFFGIEYNRPAEEFNPQINDVFEISDPIQSAGSIKLREFPGTGNITGEVMNKGNVKILERPIVDEYNLFGTLRKFYKVQVITEQSVSEGWIAELNFLR